LRSDSRVEKPIPGAGLTEQAKPFKTTPVGFIAPFSFASDRAVVFLFGDTGVLPLELFILAK
jgi:hypothetical protein